MTAAWTPDDALVEKAARAMFDLSSWGKEAWDMHLARAVYRDSARAALIAAYPDMVAEAVKAERERADRILSFYKNVHRVDGSDMSAEALIDFVMDRARRDILQELYATKAVLTPAELEAAIRARHP